MWRSYPVVQTTLSLTWTNSPQCPPLTSLAVCCDKSSLQARRAHGRGCGSSSPPLPSFSFFPSFFWSAEESSWGRTTGQGSPTTPYHNRLSLTERHPPHPSCTVLTRGKESPGKERSPFCNQGTINLAELTAFPCMSIFLWKWTQDPWPKSNVLNAGTCRRGGGRHL